MNTQIQGPRGGPDVTRRNKRSRLYVNSGDAPAFVEDANAPNGSLRIRPDTINGTKFEFQMKLAGVWNDASIQVAGASVFIGRDLAASGAGEYISTSSAIDNKTSLIPHIRYSDLGTGIPTTPILGPKQIRVIVQGSDVSEVTGTFLESPIPAPSALLASRIYLKTGSIGATSDIQTTFRRDNGAGPIFWQKNLPKALMETPNTEFFIDFFDLLEGFENETVSHTFESTQLLSLKTSVSGEFWLASDFFPLSEEQLMTFETGLDKIVTSKGSVVCSAGNVVSSTKGS